MPRPEFPCPYSPLTADMIDFINREQEYYDRDPEKAEREQAEQKERMEEEARLEYEYWEEEYRQQQEMKDRENEK